MSANKTLLMGYGSIFLGRDLLSILESSSSGSSPAQLSHSKTPLGNHLVNEGVPLSHQDTTTYPSQHIRREPVYQAPAPTVNNIIINNYNGSVLKNITNLDP